MKLKKVNIKAFLLGATFTLISSGCSINHEDKTNKISYEDLINNYKIVDFTSFGNHKMHIVKKKNIQNSCYGYYDIYENKCIIKVDEEAGSIIGKGIISNIREYDIVDYLNDYNAINDYYTMNELDYLIEMVRKDYQEKVLVK